MRHHALLKDHADQTLIEEIFNSLTHGIGALSSVAALVILVVLAAEHHGPLRVVSCSIFGASLVIMYSASALYHAVQKPRWKYFYQVMDHVAIYFLIAGTYTPIVLTILPPAWGWTLFGLVWGLAFIGLVFKLFATGKYNIISTVAYLCMGWLAIVAAKPIYDALPFNGLMWLLAGGLFYTGGVVFYMLDRVRFAHAIWHLFVLGGSTCHFFFVLYYVIPAVRV